MVTGPAFRGSSLSAIGRDRVLVPTSTWKAVYTPARQQTGVYVCHNVARNPGCSHVSVAELTRMTGIDPFPALPARMKQNCMTLPYGRVRHHNPYTPPHHTAACPLPLVKVPLITGETAMTTHSTRPGPAATGLVPFADNSTSRTIGGMTVENGTDSIAFMARPISAATRPGWNAPARCWRSCSRWSIRWMHRQTCPTACRPARRPGCPIPSPKGIL
ncbi:DNA/RNA non-specific endonuclease [Komagataeibacter rhaeticus]|nr:DNA/RNA non-specific endonuclease [Komagataeibacter rhaeticus]